MPSQPQLHLHPAVGVNVYSQLPQALSDTLKHAANNGTYPTDMYHAIRKQHTRQSKSDTNVTPLF